MKGDTFSLYANVIYFGHGEYGLYAASKTYFGQPPSELNDGELTMLASSLELYPKYRISALTDNCDHKDRVP